MPLLRTPPVVVVPGVMVSVLVPRPAKRELICALVPEVSVTTAITAPTPTTMPNTVSSERVRFAHSAASALANPARKSGPRRVGRRFLVAVACALAPGFAGAPPAALLALGVSTAVAVGPPACG